MYIPTRYNTLFIIIIIIPCFRDEHVHTEHLVRDRRGGAAPDYSGVRARAPRRQTLLYTVYIIRMVYSGAYRLTYGYCFITLLYGEIKKIETQGRRTHEVPPICRSLTRPRSGANVALVPRIAPLTQIAISPPTCNLR